MNNNVPLDMVIHHIDNFNESNLSRSTSQAHSTMTYIYTVPLLSLPIPLVTHHNILSHMIIIVLIIIGCIDLNTNLESWRPVKATKIFSTNFTGISNVNSDGSKNIKITVYSIVKGNLYLNSDFVTEHSFSACTTSNFICSFGITTLTMIFLKVISGRHDPPFTIESFGRTFQLARIAILYLLVISNSNL